MLWNVGNDWSVWVGRMVGVEEVMLLCVLELEHKLSPASLSFLSVLSSLPLYLSLSLFLSHSLPLSRLLLLSHPSLSPLSPLSSLSFLPPQQHACPLWDGGSMVLLLRPLRLGLQPLEQWVPEQRILNNGTLGNGSQIMDSHHWRHLALFPLFFSLPIFLFPSLPLLSLFTNGRHQFSD